MALSDIPVQAQPISGSLDFGGVPAADDYASAYSNALNLNKQNYSNILAGYQSTAAAQQQAAAGILAGYGTLSAGIQNQIRGTDASQRQALTDQYVAESGKQSQGLINRGLGNTTVANSVQRGLSLDHAKANIQLSNQMAQLMANYQVSIGQAGLNYANQANQQRTALSQDQLRFMNSVNSPYPDARRYQELAQQKGAVRAGLGGAGAGGGGGMRGNGMSRGSGLGGGGGRHPTTFAGTGAPFRGDAQLATNTTPAYRGREQTLGESSFGGDSGYYTNPFGSEGGGAAGDANYPAQAYGSGDVWGSGDAMYPAQDYYSQQAEPVEDWNYYDEGAYDDQGAWNWNEGYEEDWNYYDESDYYEEDYGGDEFDNWGGYYDNYSYSEGDDEYGGYYYTYDDGSYDWYDDQGEYGGFYGADDSYYGDDWYDY